MYVGMHVCVCVCVCIFLSICLSLCFLSIIYLIYAAAAAKLLQSVKNHEDILIPVITINITELILLLSLAMSLPPFHSETLGLILHNVFSYLLIPRIGIKCFQNW